MSVHNSCNKTNPCTVPSLLGVPGDAVPSLRVCRDFPDPALTFQARSEPALALLSAHGSRLMLLFHHHVLTWCRRITASVVGVLKTTCGGEAATCYGLSSDNGRAAEKYIPVNFGFVLSCLQAVGAGLRGPALSAVAAGPSWGMPGLVGAPA